MIGVNAATQWRFQHRKPAKSPTRTTPGLPSPAEWPPLRRFFTRHRDAKRIMDGFPAQAALQAAGGSRGRQLYRADAASNDRLTTNHESDKAYL
jgi:hypothetical protein